MVDLPYIAWLAPFALYMGVILCRAVPNLYWRLLLMMAALAGNILLLKGYDRALTALGGMPRSDAQRCVREHPDGPCPNPYSLSDAPAQPLHWEWALVGYVLAAAGLYFLLYVIEQHMARRGRDTA